VHEGDVVHRGDVLGSLGNSGNSTAPHLHFHVARGLGGLETEGVPYTFEHFTTQSFTEVAEDPRCVRLGDDARVLTELLPSEGTAIRFE
jgi:murein DD-endopeptidase MepM/ murein hydrolase activator NlpD